MSARRDLQTVWNRARPLMTTAARAPRVRQRPGRLRLALALVVATTASAWGGSVAEAQRLASGPTAWTDTERGGIRGVTIGPIESAQQPGRGYGTQSSEALLDHLAEMGVTWVSLTPFGRIWSLSSTDIQMDFEAPYEDNRIAVRTMIHQARERGIRVLLIPHLWVETTGWRGEIDPGTPEGWIAYQASYRAFLMRWAQDAADAGADALSLGVECKSWSGRFPRFWTELIRDVRAVFPGLLTYSANWDEVEDVLFWDQLDFIGVNAFYPLAEAHGASDEQYLDGAVERARDVAALAEAIQRPVLFVEVGYTTRADAAVEPWLWPDGMEGVVIDEREQARALEAMFRAFLGEPWFAGFFVWRYYASLDDVSQEARWGFSPHTKLAEQVLRDAFAAPWAADPSPFPAERTPRSWLPPVFADDPHR
ncbi:MAG: hypothetical protein R3B40_29040 [Polyangiales bacterium]|nr:hypothetical protein [Sandaracinaceae bacterium]